MTFAIGDAIRSDKCRADSTLHWAEISSKKVFVLRQKGSFADLCYDHGHLLAEQIDTGVFPEILDTIHTATDMESDFFSWVISAIYRRISDQVFDACPDEFRDGGAALGDGIFDTLDDPRFSASDVRDAVVAIDVGNCAEGLARRLETPLAPEASDTIIYVLVAARKYRRRRTSMSLLQKIQGDREGVGKAAQRLNHISRRVGFGCTGFGAAPALTDDGRGLHARTFDGAFFAWNNWPGIFVIDERETNPAWHRYVAIGTAGLTYPGGISGMNDQGLAASIHQMSTTQYDVGRAGRRYSIAPFLQQRILREAATLDQADKILTDARHFGSWTITVSDAKAGQAARFEINGGTQSVTRTDLGTSFTQSNHFLHRDTEEKFDFYGDQHFTPTFGKWLESRARLRTAQAALDKAGSAGGLTTDTAISVLSGHGDGYLDGASRSFGRTVCKSYGLMGSIARADPDRTRADDQIWMSIGNASPGPHADYAGFKIDWEALTVTPVDDNPVRTPGMSSPEFGRATSDYVAAFQTYARPTDGRGEYLGRDPTPAEYQKLLDDALQHLDRACQAVEDAGETDFALRYARARVRHQAKHFDKAADDWSFLRSLPDMGFKVLEYEEALVWTLSAATAFAQGKQTEAQDFLTKGEAKLNAVRDAHFPGGATAHPDLDDWADVVKALKDDGAGADLPDLDWVTVE
ncbi:MAG: C45 family autoproteolytic acyltransferase/hydrolase [Pseudomonadota bacterium]